MYLKRPRIGLPLPILIVASLLMQSCAASSACLDEAERARDIQRRIDNELPLRGSDPVVDYVRAFGWRLAERAGVEDAAHWRFEVLRDRSVNAFSIGDGHIYVTEGTILAANNESELAGVIAHEMGHQLAGHFCLSAYARYSQGSHENNGDSRLHGNRPAVPGLGTLRQGMDPLKEREADQVAIDLLADAGIDVSVRSNVIRRAQGRGPKSLGDSAALSRGGQSMARQARAKDSLVGEVALLRAKQILVMESR